MASPISERLYKATCPSCSAALTVLSQSSCHDALTSAARAASGIGVANVENNSSAAIKFPLQNICLNELVIRLHGIGNVVSLKIDFHLPTLARKNLIGGLRSRKMESELLGHFERVARTARAHAEFVSRVALIKDVVDQLIQAP